MRTLLLSMCLCVLQVQCPPCCAPPDPNDPGNGDGSGQPQPGDGINSEEQPSGTPIPESGEPVTVQVLSENDELSATVNVVFTVLDVDVHRAFLTVGPLETADPIGPDLAAIVRIDGTFETGHPLQSRVYILGQDFVADDTIVYIIPDSDNFCFDDPDKVSPGLCGCGVPDTDSDGDGTPDCVDLCPEDSDKINPGACGCDELDTDSDGDTVADCRDECPEDADKSETGLCGCGVEETDTDEDGTPDCVDECPNDPRKTDPGRCGCGNSENCGEPPITDCNDNGVDDAMDLENGTSEDCNCNEIPDECDIENLTSADCNEDGIPDECVNCEPLEIVVIFDTSGSLSDEAQALCPAMEAVIDELQFLGISVDATFLGTTSTGPAQLFPCLEGTVANLLGTDPPGELGVVMNDVEDWGLATAIVAERYEWDSYTTRIIIPVSDEAPLDGDPCNDPGNDRDVIEQAIASATENGVIVDPLLGDGASACVRTLAEDLAQGTGGAVIDGVPSQDEIEDFLERLLSELCSVNSYCPEVPPTGQNYEDCNDNGLADTCEIPYYWNQREQPSCGDHCAEDCNENEIPDECDIASGESSDVDPQDGIPDECQRFQ